jgi:hypothetical protein
MDGEAATRFLTELFRGTEGDVYVCSLPNERGTKPGERYVATRNPAEVVTFAEKWDRPGRGLFFCISTLKPDANPTPRGSLRCKANAWQVPAIHADIDYDKVVIPELGHDNKQAYVTSRLEKLAMPPSIIVSSGGGIHAYWLLAEPLEDHAVAEDLMRGMALLVAGDPAVCEVSRLMRLPGSHNSKRGEPTRTMILKLTGERRV